MNGDRQTVTVSLESIEAYAEPQFVLEYDGKVYVTVGVVEFDPNEDMDDDERSDLAELQAMLEGERMVSGTVMGEPREAAAMAQSESRDDI
jgi:hypothetical protein